MNGPRRWLPIFALFVAVPLLRADFTMGYEVILELPSWLSPALAKQLKDGAKTRLPEFLAVQVRGDKGFFGTTKFKVIVDFPKQQVTILDPPSRRFATLPVKDYPAAVRAAMPAVPALVQQALGTAKPTFAIRKTGQKQNVLGLPAEEYEATYSFAPAGELAARYSSEIAKTVLRLWVAAPEDLVTPGVSYYMDKMQFLITNMNLVVLTQLGLGAMPGGGEEFTAAIEDLTKENALIVQAELDLYAPTMAMAAAALAEPAGQAPVQGVIVAKVSEELGGLSFDVIEDDDLAVPLHFDRVTPQEILSRPGVQGSPK